MTCLHCGEPARLHDRWCSRACMLEERREDARFDCRRRIWALRGPPERFPAFVREMRTVLLAKRALDHRVRPCPGMR